MPDILLKNSDLDFVDKAAVVAVFLLAGVFLWQFIGDDFENETVNVISKGSKVNKTSYKAKHIDLKAKQKIPYETASQQSKTETPVKVKKEKKIAIVAPPTLINEITEKKPLVFVKEKPVIQVNKTVTPITPITP
ncbi:MAG: hypothetical protein KAH20_15755, partial [Methylococcales bacterium]|nr:hypothetical protein [Methylococcales bacterium]